MSYWTQYCQPPRKKPDHIKWDVFISYQHLDRVWAIALYDMLTQCGYEVYLDRYESVTGEKVTKQISSNLDASASGVLIWSDKTKDSEWVEHELDLMRNKKRKQANSDFPFHFVPATLNGQVPTELEEYLYVNFSDYPDGPVGENLIRLSCGLQGKPMSREIDQKIKALEDSLKSEPHDLKALATVKKYDEILAKIQSDDPAYLSSATLPSLAIDLLIRGKQYQQALAACEIALPRFTKSLRLKQLKGLALRRSGDLDQAIFELNRLLSAGHHDTETLGILAAAYADQWQLHLENHEPEEAQDALEHSRELYLTGFTKEPSDTYTGINAAAKSALLGEQTLAMELAEKVLVQIAQDNNPTPDYWTQVTEAEALLIKGEHQQAQTLYHQARIKHKHEAGNIESTATQLNRLLGVLDVAEDIKAKLTKDFKIAAQK